MRWFDLAEQDAKLEMVEDGPGATKLVLDMAAEWPRTAMRSP